LISKDEIKVIDEVKSIEPIRGQMTKKLPSETASYKKSDRRKSEEEDLENALQKRSKFIPMGIFFKSFLIAINLLKHFLNFLKILIVLGFNLKS
jgi:hypothetical protein